MKHSKLLALLRCASRRLGAPDSSKSRLVRIIILLTACLALSAAVAQVVVPDFIEVIVGRDFSNLPPSRQDILSAAVDPIKYNQEREKSKTAKDRANEAIAAFAITDPEAYARLNPVTVPPAKAEALARDKFSIIHPAEAQTLANAAKSKEQRADEELMAWIITHPKEYQELAEKLKTPEEKRQDSQIAAQGTGAPVGTPIFRKIAIPEEFKAALAREIAAQKKQ